jgi:hypothetical protein
MFTIHDVFPVAVREIGVTVNISCDYLPLLLVPSSDGVREHRSSEGRFLHIAIERPASIERMRAIARWTPGEPSVMTAIAVESLMKLHVLSGAQLRLYQVQDQPSKTTHSWKVHSGYVHTYDGFIDPCGSIIICVSLDTPSVCPFGHVVIAIVLSRKGFPVPPFSWVQ